MARLCPPAKLQAATTVAQEDLDEGLELLENLVRKYAKDPSVRYAYGAALLDAGVPAEALDHLEFAERKEPDDDVREVLLDAYFALGMIVHAERLVQRTGGRLDDHVDAALEQQRNHGPTWHDVPRKDRIALERARVAAMRMDSSASSELTRLVDRQPGWTVARTTLAGALFAEGRLDAFYVEADAAYRADPEDSLALLHATRAAFLREGSDAAKAFRDGLPATRSHKGAAWAFSDQAEAAALMEDENVLRAALSALEAVPEEAPEAVLDGVMELRDALERREEDPDAPLASLASLIFGTFRSWLGRDPDEVEARAGRDLARAPGLLRELPERLGYEEAGTVRILAGALLSEGAPPAPDAPWDEVLARIATEGPGMRAGRVALLSFLHETGQLDASDGVPFAGVEGGVSMHGFEVSGEPVPTSLSEQDQQRLETVMRQLTSGRPEPALALLPELLQAYPNEASLAFNLAMAERMSGQGQRASARLERLLETHPDYLFARSDLAVRALDAGDVERAEGLLSVPTGRTRLHVNEWTAFAAAQGRLALARGDVDGAEEALSIIEQVAGDDHGAYRMLEAAIDDQVLNEQPDDEDAWLEDLDLATSAEPVDVPTPDELRALPRLDETWAVAVEPVAFAIGERGALQRLGMLAFVSDDGYVRAMTVLDAGLDEDDVYVQLARACEGGGDATGVRPGRPRAIACDDDALATALDGALDGTGMRVERGDASLAREAIASAAANLGSGVPAWLVHAGRASAWALLRACDAFYRAEPWRAFPADRPLAFRVGDDGWRYATLMGHEGEEFGMAIFQSWTAFQAFLSPDDEVDARERFTAAGGFESVSSSPLSAVSPLDAPFYLEATRARFADDEVPHFVRYEPDGLGTPSYDPSVYAPLLALLAQRAARVVTQVRRIDATLETPEGPLRVRYPADGSEEAAEPKGARTRA